MHNFKSEKELFEYIVSQKAEEVTSIRELLSQYILNSITIRELLNKVKSDPANILLIDSRSEKEFEESSIPYSKNFPVLNNIERHYTGLVYKKYSSSSAVKLAKEFADPKVNRLRDFLRVNNSEKKSIFIYCWRGGGRSGYLSKMIDEAGYRSVTLKGGFKSFRREAVSFLTQKPFPYELLEIYGNTGCGKSDILKNLSGEIPVIDLEAAARHYSSLLGHIPYQLKGFSKIHNQSAFENKLFSQVYFYNTIGSADNVVRFLIEGESRRVGNFNIPLPLFEKLQSAPCIKIVSSLECRINRIVKDYFGNDLSGIEPMKKIMFEKERYFRQQISNKVYEELINLLDRNNAKEFTEIMIRDYYDKKYKDKGKKPLAVISSDNISDAVKEIKDIYIKFI